MLTPNLKIDTYILSKIITVVHYYSHYVLHYIICFKTFSQFSQQTSNKSFISIPILQKVQTTYLIEAIDLKTVGQGMGTGFSYYTVYELNHSMMLFFNSPPALSGRMIRCWATRKVFLGSKNNASSRPFLTSFHRISISTSVSHPETYIHTQFAILLLRQHPKSHVVFFSLSQKQN